jgi:hypothetical protein
MAFSRCRCSYTATDAPVQPPSRLLHTVGPLAGHGLGPVEARLRIRITAPLTSSRTHDLSYFAPAEFPPRPATVNKNRQHRRPQATTSLALRRAMTSPVYVATQLQISASRVEDAHRPQHTEQPEAEAGEQPDCEDAPHPSTRRRALRIFGGHLTGQSCRTEQQWRCATGHHRCTGERHARQGLSQQQYHAPLVLEKVPRRLREPAVHSE